MRTLWPFAWLAACCTDPAISLLLPAERISPVGQVWEVPIESIVPAYGADWSLDVSATDGARGGVSSDGLYVIPQTGWAGPVDVHLAVTSPCGQTASIDFELLFGGLGGRCLGRVEYVARSGGRSVDILGDFSGFNPMPMSEDSPGLFSIELPLAPGAYAYRVAESGRGTTCDPSATRFSCELDRADAQWNDCDGGGAASCDSLLVVPNCDEPRLELEALKVDSGLSFTLRYLAGSSGAQVGSAVLSVDGVDSPHLDGWTGDAPLSVDIGALSAGRHRVQVTLSDTEGRSVKPVHLPLWTDGSSWDDGLLYFAFVDRFFDGAPANNPAQQTADERTDFMGGDWLGLTSKLDYLDSLGVRSLWINAPMQNPEGVFGSECGVGFTGYHGYWPTSADQVDARFGSESDLVGLISAAHDRGMRVMVDWVGNHVHEDHPYAARDWFSPFELCDAANNWDDIPERCWFDSFLPDIDYRRPEPLVQMVDDAIALAKRLDLDGFRVDAVKHMPHSVHANLGAAVRDELEHRGAFDFYTLGETFDGRFDRVSAYMNGGQLDGQFDFPQYFAIREAFIDRTIDLEALEASGNAGREAFSGHRMSTFLGNHDVPRFSTVAADALPDVCDLAGGFSQPAPRPVDPAAYDALKMAWTWLLTNEGLPLVYYGDEFGLPGGADPDNRAAMRFGSELSRLESDVLEHVRRLGQARLRHPALHQGQRSTWWEEPEVLAWSRVFEGRAMIAAMNRSNEDRVLENGLSFAGIAPDAQFVELFTDEGVTGSSDRISLTVPANSSRVWIER